MDDEEATRELILRLALEDVNERRERIVGKAKAGSMLTDEQMALQDHAKELDLALQLLIDAHFAQSLNKAMNTDADLLREFDAREQMELVDRNIALGLSRPGSIRNSAIPSQMATPHRSGAVSPVSLNQKRAPIPLLGTIKEGCVICMEVIGRKPSIKAPCGHYYDEKCLLELVKTASTDESSFPPRCCREPIPEDSLMPFLSRKVLSDFKRASNEFSTKPRDRIYCSNRICSQFLTAAKDPGVARLILCQNCDNSTCSRCREGEHQDRLFCKFEDDADAIQELMKEEKWQRCPECRRVIELTQGCYHLTCFCKTQFCYVCAAGWKTCKCPQWDEHLLLEEAGRRVDAAMEFEAEGRYNAPQMVRFQPPRVREIQMEQVARRLRTNHACTHDWRKRNGGGSCGNCGHYLQLYLLSCRDCYMAVCVRCARNRL